MGKDPDGVFFVFFFRDDQRLFLVKPSEPQVMSLWRMGLVRVSSFGAVFDKTNNSLRSMMGEDKKNEWDKKMTGVVDGGQGLPC